VNVMPAKKTAKTEKTVEDFSKRVETEGKKLDKQWKSWWYNTFGVIAPIVSGVIVVVFLAMLVWVIQQINSSINDLFLGHIANFLLVNLAFFFVVTLVLGYGKYLEYSYREKSWMFKPIFTSIGATFVFWFIAWTFTLLNSLFENKMVYGSAAEGGFSFGDIASSINYNLFVIFLVFLILGYCVMFIKRALKR
jgi:disulfide bond formation protein DsbB